MIRSGKTNYKNFGYLDIPDKELNVHKFTEQIILFEGKTVYGHIRITNSFPFC